MSSTESVCFMGRNMLLISPSLSQGWEEGAGYEVLSWLVYWQRALGPLVLADVSCWHSSLLDSCTGPCVWPSWNMDGGLSSSSCFSPSASILTLSVGFPLLFQAFLGRIQKAFQACSVSQIEYIWSTEKTRVAFGRTLDTQTDSTPGLSWLLQSLLGMSHTLVPMSPKEKSRSLSGFIKVPFLEWGKEGSNLNCSHVI